ncbi:MAG: hypothetical protein FWF31_03490, partial [Desulfobulbus sp.]|nr:hypothetical protein [Desulfobulbus sp.]
AQGLVLDLAVFTAAAPEQMGMADLALAGTLGGDDVCGSFSCRHGGLDHISILSSTAFCFF